MNNAFYYNNYNESEEDIYYWLDYVQETAISRTEDTDERIKLSLPLCLPVHTKEFYFFMQHHFDFEISKKTLRSYQKWLDEYVLMEIQKVDNEVSFASLIKDLDEKNFLNEITV